MQGFPDLDEGQWLLTVGGEGLTSLLTGLNEQFALDQSDHWLDASTWGDRM